MSAIPEFTSLSRVRDTLYRHNSGQLREREPLALRTTYRVGGEAKLLYAPYEEADVAAAVQTVCEEQVPLYVLGGGSNILIADNGIDGLLVDTRSYLNTISLTGDRIVAQAGASLLRLVRMASRAGLGGIAKLAGIPGTLGGGLRMNCGAFGVEISEHLEWVRGVSANGEIVEFEKSDITWGYRSVPELQTVVITAAGFRFPTDDPNKLVSEMREVLAKRRASQPLQYPSAGSVFKRPPNDFAGRLIEAAGLKGVRCGDAEVSQKHAGFVVNTGKATAADIYRLIRTVQAAVFALYGVQLEMEQVLWGFENAAS
ncbi:MAG: UDP-N-acetylmuramate dehydrogenase [bacterium]|nr:UDP-N-acetylmuramate dehydrogenase [bacterium]